MISKETAETILSEYEFGMALEELRQMCRSRVAMHLVAKFASGEQRWLKLSSDLTEQMIDAHIERNCVEMGKAQAQAQGELNEFDEKGDEP